MGFPPAEDTRPITVIRGVAYDLTEFMEKHPGGRYLIAQAVGRDATGLFESYHVRHDIANAALTKLPKVDKVPSTITIEPGPFPNDSPIYRRIRDRVRKDVLKNRTQRGGLAVHIAIDVVITVLAYLFYLRTASVLGGVLLGLVAAHIGMTLNHCANHGGLTQYPALNFMFGFANDLIGGSSLIWSYHHHVSHHIHTNSIHRDQDVFSAFPFLRFDHRLPRKWFHAYQYIYMTILFPFLWLILSGATERDYALAVAGKVVHFSLLLLLPLHHHGFAAWVPFLVYATVGSITLAWLFAISHNLEETKHDFAKYQDWGVEQIGHSANYGGRIAGWLTGGLNLQIEHHLFPAMAYNLYPDIVPIVKEECRKASIPYTAYSNVPEMIIAFIQFMKDVGQAPTAKSVH